MDDLRWILLSSAVVIVVVIYFFTRARKKDQYELPLSKQKEVPSFSATDEVADNDWRDGVGPVRVVAASAEILIDENKQPEVDAAEEPEIQDIQNPAEVSPAETTAEQPEKTEELESAEIQPTAEESDVAIDDVISVYVLAKADVPIKGEKILGASYALHLDYGDMKIFHRHSQTQSRDIEFSMANTQQPGWFEIDDMNEMQTTGLSFFMQVNLVEKPSAVLDEMLICAHSLSTLLGATLCNAQRQPLDEASTIELRKKVKRLEVIKSQSV